MALSNLSEEENVLFYKKLQLRFEEEYKTMKQFVPFSKLSEGNIILIPQRRIIMVDKHPISKISNQIIYFSNNPQNDVFHLLKHLRNCIAHNRITRQKIDNIIRYKFEDKTKLQGKYRHTLKGYIKKDDWENFVDFIYNESQALQQEPNTL